MANDKSMLAWEVLSCGSMAMPVGNSNENMFPIKHYNE